MQILGSTSGATGMTVAGFTTSGGSSLSELDRPSSIALDDYGTLYVLDTNNYRVMKFLPDEPLGARVAGSGVTGTTLDKIGTSYYMALDRQSNIYISEYSNNRVTRWMAGNSTAGTIVCMRTIKKSILWRVL